MKECSKHIKPNFVLFIAVLAISMYKLMDKVMLGSMSNVIQNGYYENRHEHYVNNRYDWTEDERKNFISKYFLKLTKQTPLLPGAKDVINMLQQEGNEFVIISARGGVQEGMQEAALERFNEEGLSFDKYYWSQINKLDVAKKENIDLMIDDAYHICKELSANGIRTIYFRDKEMKKLEQYIN